MNAKLWTGKTARQELVSHAVTSGSVHGVTAAEAVEFALEGTSQCPEGSTGYGKWYWWVTASDSSRNLLIAEIRRKLKAEDRLMGRRVAR